MQAIVDKIKEFMKKNSEKRYKIAVIIVIVLIVGVILFFFGLHNCGKNRQNAAQKSEINAEVIKNNEKDNIRTIEVTIKNANGIKKIVFPDGTIKEYQNETELTVSFEVTEGGIYTFIITDAKGQVETKKVSVELESVKPKDQEVNDSEVQIHPTDATKFDTQTDFQVKGDSNTKMSQPQKEAVSQAATVNQDNKGKQIVVNKPEPEPEEPEPSNPTPSEPTPTPPIQNKIEITYTNNGNLAYQSIIQTQVKALGKGKAKISQLYYKWDTTNDMENIPAITESFSSGAALSLDTGGGIYYLWVKAVDNTDKEYYAVSKAFHLDAVAPDTSNLQFKRGETGAVAYLRNNEDMYITFSPQVTGVTDNVTATEFLKYKYETCDDTTLLWKELVISDGMILLNFDKFRVVVEDQPGNIAYKEIEYWDMVGPGFPGEGDGDYEFVTMDTSKENEYKFYNTTTCEHKQYAAENYLPFMSSKAWGVILLTQVHGICDLSDQCPTGMFSYGLLCVAQCPEGTTIVDGECVLR